MKTETITAIPSAPTSYKPAAKQACWTVLMVLILAPFLIAVPPAVQTVLYSVTAVTLGCLYSIEFAANGTHRETNEDEEKMELSDAVSFPVYASIALISLYFLYNTLPKDLLNNLFKVNFCVLGFSILFPFIQSRIPIFFPVVPEKKYGEIKKTIGGIDIHVDLSTHSFIGMALAGLIVVMYFVTNNWSFNNILGLSFTVAGIKLIRIPNFKYALAMLWLLFVYDIVWVFKTDVMVTVARSFDAPIKLLFPIGSAREKFSLLGLGDMVLPGICIALLLKFEIDMLIRKRCAFFIYLYFVGSLVYLSVSKCAPFSPYRILYFQLNAPIKPQFALKPPSKSPLKISNLSYPTLQTSNPPKK